VHLPLPQAGQSFEQLAAGVNDPEGLLEEARDYWAAWRPTKEPVEWNLHGRHDEFLNACARNIMQAREVKEGKLTFQVGPTVYRGLWVVDGNFLLEAARYLGYDRDAEQGLRSTWRSAVQVPFCFFHAQYVASVIGCAYFAHFYG
jgi:hypothetical protein